MASWNLHSLQTPPPSPPFSGPDAPPLTPPPPPPSSSSSSSFSLLSSSHRHHHLREKPARSVISYTLAVQEFLITVPDASKCWSFTVHHSCGCPARHRSPIHVRAGAHRGPCGRWRGCERAWAVLELPALPPPSADETHPRGGGGGDHGEDEGGEVELDWSGRNHGTRQKQQDSKPWSGEWGKCPRCEMLYMGCSIVPA